MVESVAATVQFFLTCLLEIIMSLDCSSAELLYPLYAIPVSKLSLISSDACGLAIGFRMSAGA